MGMYVDWRVQIDRIEMPGDLEKVVDEFLESICVEREEPLAEFSFSTETLSAYREIPAFLQELSKREDVVLIDLYFKVDIADLHQRKTFVGGGLVDYETIVMYKPI